jgi:hypothetical protein
MPAGIGRSKHGSNDAPIPTPPPVSILGVGRSDWPLATRPQRPASFPLHRHAGDAAEIGRPQGLHPRPRHLVGQMESDLGTRLGVGSPMGTPTPAFASRGTRRRDCRFSLGRIILGPHIRQNITSYQYVIKTAALPNDEHPPPHSIISSGRTRNGCGMVTPIWPIAAARQQGIAGRARVRCSAMAGSG